MNFLHRLFKRDRVPIQVPFVATPNPDRPLFVVGDIHGSETLLIKMLEYVAENTDGSDHDLVFVGDFIDRGENSAAVLKIMHAQSAQSNVTSLMGNHERMMLDFISNPERYGRRWLRNGGLQTLASFDVGEVTETSSEDCLRRARDRLLKKLGPLETWLEQMPLSFQSGNIFVTHAAAHPEHSIADQSAKTFLWGHPAFFNTPRTDGNWVAHGHYVVETASTKDGRISVDTGAYATGRLTAAKIVEGNISFITITL